MRHLPRRAGVAATALSLAASLAACGGFDSKASGESLIRDYVKKQGGGRITVKSVSCPGGVKKQVGHTYDCKVNLHITPTNTDHSGTITIHIESGDKVAILGRQDVHVP